MKKILCPFHEETTPSCALYLDNYYCFGCNASGPLDELEGVKLPPKEELEPQEPEDLNESFLYINSLPLIQQRGHELPTDDRSFFIVWPGDTYYKRRFFSPGDGPKYIGAKGHRRPLFWANKRNNEILAVVEGEINSLSVAEACPEIDVVSPGGVGDFTEKKVIQNLYNYTNYRIIVVIADADKPGAEAIINTLAVFWSKKINAVGLPMTTDANEVLTTSGTGEIRKQVFRVIERAMDRSTSQRRMPT